MLILKTLKLRNCSVISTDNCIQSDKVLSEIITFAAQTIYHMFLKEASLLDTVLNNKDIKAFIFDMDGTLVDTLPAHYEAWLQACSEFKVSFSMDYFQSLTGRPATELGKDLIRTFNMPVDPNDLVKQKEALVNEQLHKVKVFDPILEVIEKFHSRIPMAVGTGARREMADRILETTKLQSFFDFVVTSDDVTNYKPHPETFIKSSDHFGVDRKNCLVFEDGHLGIEAAKTAGMMVIDVKQFY